jgi:hypothetical protein
VKTISNVANTTVVSIIIAGFFEGSIAEWLRERGIEEARTELGSALGKMSGCLLGSGFVLTIALLLGIQARPMLEG